MDHVHLLFLRQRDNAFDIEVSADGPFAFADQVGFVRLEPVNREPVFLGVDGYGAQPEFRSGTKDANGDLTAIGDEEFPEGALGFLTFYCIVTSRNCHVARVYSGSRRLFK